MWAEFVDLKKFILLVRPVCPPFPRHLVSRPFVDAESDVSASHHCRPAPDVFGHRQTQIPVKARKVDP